MCPVRTESPEISSIQEEKKLHDQKHNDTWFTAEVLMLISVTDQTWFPSLPHFLIIPYCIRKGPWPDTFKAANTLLLHTLTLPFSLKLCRWEGKRRRNLIAKPYQNVCGQRHMGLQQLGSQPLWFLGYVHALVLMVTQTKREPRHNLPPASDVQHHLPRTNCTAPKITPFLFFFLHSPLGLHLSCTHPGQSGHYSQTVYTAIFCPLPCMAVACANQQSTTWGSCLVWGRAHAKGHL